MADAFTVNYGFTKIDPGSSGWDVKNNANFEAIDTVIFNIDTNLAATDVRGLQTIWVPAAAMLPTVSNGCIDLTQYELTAGQPDIQALVFNAGADQFAQFNISMPKSWDKGIVLFQPFWSGQTLEANDVIWTLQGVAVANDSPLDVSYGAAVSVIDTFGSAANDLMVASVSGNMTIGGNPANDDTCIFRIGRNGANVADTYTANALLIGAKILFIQSVGNDA